MIDHPYSPSKKRCSPAFCIYLILLAGLRCLALDSDKLNTLPVDSSKAYDFKIPSRPGGHVLDTAHFLTQETLKRLDDALSKEAHDHGVNVYLLTVPSVQKDTLNPFTQRVAEQWITGLFGATIVFDDETGRVAIQQSDLVTKRFYEFELSVLLKDTMNTSKRPRLSREGLEHTAVSVKTALHELKDRVDHEDRNSRLMRVGLGIVGLFAVLVGVFEYFRRRPAAGATSGGSASDNPS